MKNSKEKTSEFTSHSSVGTVRFNVLHRSTGEHLTTTIIFEERNQDIYYCWTINDKAGNSIASKCLAISKRITKGDMLGFCISHAKESIDTYRIGRKRVFQVEDAFVQEM